MLTLLLGAAKAPSGAWPAIINWVQSFIGSYGWTIIFITVILKLIMMPLDFWMKLGQKKMSISQKALAPELEMLKKKYGYDKNILNQKQSELYKKHNVNPMGSCLPVVINLFVVIFVFVTLINSLTSMSNYKMQEQFKNLQTVYEQTLEETSGNVDEAEQAVIVAYKDKYRDSFLWIKNIWRKDTSESVIPSYKDVQKTLNAGLKEEDEGYITEEKYNLVMQPLIDTYGKQWNGYYLLVVICVVATVLTALITQLDNKKGGQPKEQNKSAWTTQIVMIIISAVFCFISSSTFALYLAASQILAVISTLITTPLVNLIIKEGGNKKKNKGNNDTKSNDGGSKVSYSRY